MNIAKFVRFALIIGGVCCCLLPFFPVRAADASVKVPSIISDGFSSWAQKGASYAFDVWRMGGVMENDRKPAALTAYFGQIDRTIGNYKSYEAIETKKINQSSQIVYLSINFDHAAIYGRFLLYRTDKGWVVQNMDFSPKPEAVMPWLAFAGGDYSQ